jgi:hypothetical protein
MVINILLHLDILAYCAFSSRSQNTRVHSPVKRKCRFSDENFLDRFAEYSRLNCYHEKEMKILEEECGCTSRDYFTGNYPVCQNSTCMLSKTVRSRFFLMM